MPFEFIAGQVLSILATVITFISYQVFTKNKLLILQTSATLCICASYLFLDANVGWVLNIICIIRNVCYYFIKAGRPIHYFVTSMIAVAMVVFGILSWQGPVSLLMIGGLAINSVAMSIVNPQLLRKSILITSPMVLVYNIFVFSIGGIMNETIAILASVIGIIRFSKLKETEHNDGKAL